MGHLSRQPTSNDLPSVPSDNPWSPRTELADETSALLARTAIRCCGCRRVLASKHVSIVSSHAFCPDCKAGANCTRDRDCQYNIGEFLEKHPDIKAAATEKAPPAET